MNDRKHVPVIKISGSKEEVKELLKHFGGKNVKITEKERQDGNLNAYVKCFYLTQKRHADKI